MIPLLGTTSLYQYNRITPLLGMILGMTCPCWYNRITPGLKATFFLYPIHCFPSLVQGGMVYLGVSWSVCGSGVAYDGEVRDADAVLFSTFYLRKIQEHRQFPACHKRRMSDPGVEVTKGKAQGTSSNTTQSSPGDSSTVAESLSPGHSDREGGLTPEEGRALSWNGVDHHHQGVIKRSAQTSHPNHSSSNSNEQRVFSFS